jgi:hypothetical protein
MAVLLQWVDHPVSSMQPAATLLCAIGLELTMQEDARHHRHDNKVYGMPAVFTCRLLQMDMQRLPLAQMTVGDNIVCAYGTLRP